MYILVLDLDLPLTDSTIIFRVFNKSKTRVLDFYLVIDAIYLSILNFVYFSTSAYLWNNIQFFAGYIRISTRNMLKTQSNMTMTTIAISQKLNNSITKKAI